MAIGRWISTAGQGVIRYPNNLRVLRVFVVRRYFPKEVTKFKIFLREPFVAFVCCEVFRSFDSQAP
jgi:hypothetical protein